MNATSAQDNNRNGRTNNAIAPNDLAARVAPAGAAAHSRAAIGRRRRGRRSRACGRPESANRRHMEPLGRRIIITNLRLRGFCRNSSSSSSKLCCRRRRRCRSRASSGAQAGQRPQFGARSSGEANQCSIKQSAAGLCNASGAELRERAGRNTTSAEIQYALLARPQQRFDLLLGGGGGGATHNKSHNQSAEPRKSHETNDGD